MNVWLRAYARATGLLERWVPRLLQARAERGREDPERLPERLGRASLPRPDGGLVWLHGVSVGESLSHLPLIARLRRERPDLAVLVTSGTVTSARLLAERLPQGVIHQYAPVDAPGVVERFLDHWRPDLAVFVESELWPNLLLQARARGARLALVSARITDRTARGWNRLPGAARELLSVFDLVLPQDAASGERLQALGARVDGYANLKLLAEPLPYDIGQFQRLSAAIGDRAVIVAASTHPGEDELFAAAVRDLGLAPSPLLLLVPRHPERGPALAQALRAEGHAVALRSTGDAVAADVQVYVADTLGELGVFFRLAEVVLMGGSFLYGIGGHNPLEPARLAKPVVAGPDVANWADVYSDLRQAGGVLSADRREDIAARLAELLADPAQARLVGERGRAAAGRADDTLNRLWAALEPLLPPEGRR